MAANRRPKKKPEKPPTENKAQSAVFLQTAKNLGVDESGKAFELAIETIARPTKLPQKRGRG